MDEPRTMRPRLIVVEDDHDNLEALSILLARKYDVFGYQSPTAALDAIAAVRPDLLVLDIRTAPIDGVDCLRRIRAIPGFVDVPAVAFTGFGRNEEHREFLVAGFQAIVVKPVDPREFIAVVERLLASRVVADERTPTLWPSTAPVVLDLQTTRPASFARELGEEDGPPAARPADENAG